MATFRQTFSHMPPAKVIICEPAETIISGHVVMVSSMLFIYAPVTLGGLSGLALREGLREF